MTEWRLSATSRLRERNITSGWIGASRPVAKSGNRRDVAQCGCSHRLNFFGYCCSSRSGRTSVVPMSDRIERFSYLWADPSGDWVLLRSEPDSDRLAIFNKRGSVLLVEQDNLQAEICARM